MVKSEIQIQTKSCMDQGLGIRSQPILFSGRIRPGPDSLNLQTIVPTKIPSLSCIAPLQYMCLSFQNLKPPSYQLEVN